MGILRFKSLETEGSDTEIPSQKGESIFDLGWKLDVALQSACVGKGTCGLCRVTVIEGEELLTPYNEIEEKHLGNVYHLTKVRLSCQAVVISEEGTISVKPKHKKKRKEK